MTFEWLKEGAPLSPAENSETFSRDAASESDAGSYTCIAKKQILGDSEASDVLLLNVQGRLV